MSLIDSVRTSSGLPNVGAPATTTCRKLESKFSAVQMSFGRMAVRGAQDDEVAPPSTINDTPIGLVMEDCLIDPQALGTNPTGDIPAGCEICVGYRGKFVVLAEDAVTEGNAVYWRATGADNVTTFAGGFRGDDDGGNAILLNGARWSTSTTAAGQKAIIELNMP